MASYRNSSLATVTRREVGFPRRACDTAGLRHNLASSIKVRHVWDPRKTIDHTDNGGVFNFDFSKDGSILGVACERKSVLLFDPFNGKLVASKLDAHTDCVNCVKFLDNRMFATCSDDTTVTLWDARWLRRPVQNFRGHSNWVKSIEYDAGGGRLVTSGFDGCIYTWDINRYSSEDTSHRVFHTSGLMRSKLFPDASKLLISTHEGYIIVIHNLDLDTLAEDLAGFKPNMYRLMQRARTPLRLGLMHNYVFEQERNRVEFISDWPTGNDASIISSLQVHPQGWCIVSRNTDSSENAEWTCVHEIPMDQAEAKTAVFPWEAEAPPTSSSFCAPTNTRPFSSQAPSNLHPRMQQQQQQQQQESRDNTTTTHRTFSDQVSPSDTASSREQARQHSGSRLGSYASSIPANHVNASRGARRERSRYLDDVTQPVTSVGPTSSQSVRPTERAPPPVPDQGASSGRVHNALIQIRRSARNADGNFALSISVHADNGRTIEFNQSDLESDDEDDNVVIEQIISGVDNDNNDSRNAELQRRYFTRLFQRNEAAREEVNRSSSQSVPPTSNQSSVSASQAVDVEGRVGGDDNEEGDSDNMADGDYDNTNHGAADDHEDEFDLSDEGDDVMPNGDRPRGQSFLEQLFRATSGPDPPDLQQNNTNGSQTTRQNNTNGSQTTTQNDMNGSQTTTQNNMNGSQITTQNNMNGSQTTRPGAASTSTTQSVNTRTRLGVGLDEDDSDEESDIDESQSTTTSATTDSSATTHPNSLTFFIRQASGDRRRRVINLRHMDSLAEWEINQLQSKIHTNKTRLKGYVEECNVGRGFIKELAFSSDGRLISSPFGFGFRIFAFDSSCNELCDCVPTSPVKLYEVTTSIAHTNCVVATKFSPTHDLVVSGCLDGKIAFHQPIL